MKTIEGNPVDRVLTTVRWAAIGTAVCAGLVLWPASRVRTQSVPIIETVLDSAIGRPGNATVGGQAPSVAGASKRSRVIRVNLYPLPTPGTSARSREDDLELALFPDVTVRAVFDRFETVGGSGTWVGHVEGIPMSSVTLAYRDGLLTANINTRDAVFQIQPAPALESRDGDPRPLHVVSEINLDALPHGPDTVEEALEPKAAVAPPPQRLTDTGDVIDLMVVYTPAAMARAGGPAGIANSIALQVADTNAAYANSRLTQRVRLVHTALVPYTESSSDIFRDLNDLLGGVGDLSGVASLRDAQGADLVSLLVQSFAGVNCGVARLSVVPGLGPQYGYSVVADGECTSIYIMAHELGHNMGARHDWYVDASLTPYPFGHGHVDVAGRWRTIMAYPDLCADQGFTCPPIRYFSTPDLEFISFCSSGTFNCDLLRYWFFPGRPLGVREEQGTGCRVGVIPSSPCAADNRRVLNDTALTVANYRESR